MPLSTCFNVLFYKSIISLNKWLSILLNSLNDKKNYSNFSNSCMISLKKKLILILITCAIPKTKLEKTYPRIIETTSVHPLGWLSFQLHQEYSPGPYGFWGHLNTTKQTNKNKQTNKLHSFLQLRIECMTKWDMNPVTSEPQKELQNQVNYTWKLCYKLIPH